MAAGIVVGACLALPLGSSAATQPPPEPISPANGESVQVDPTSGLTLLIREKVANPIYVEVWRDGGSPLTLLTKGTYDLSVVAANVPPAAFSPTAPDSLYSGATGTVYWRPYSTCADESTFEVSTCYGETRSFIYALSASAETPPPPPESAKACRRARKLAQTATGRFRVAKRKQDAAPTRRQAARWGRIASHRLSVARRAKRRVAELCA